MKKYFTLILILLASVSYGQNLQATITQGSTSRSIYIIVKSKGVATSAGIISTVNFSVQLSNSLSPKPTVSVTPILLPASSVGPYSINDISSLTSGFYTWDISATDGTTTTGWAANQELTFLEVFFNGGPSTTTSVSLVHLNNGGPNGASTFNLAIGGIAQEIISELMYGSTAVNNTTGTYPAGNASVTLSTITLPVKFLSFTAAKKDNSAILNWQIEDESALTDHYEVERSLTGTGFESAIAIPAKNNGKSANTYTFTDANLSSLHSTGVVYYRVKQIDKDGRAVYTEIKKVHIDGKALSASIYPNPVKGNATLSINLVNSAPFTISISDASGKKVQYIQMEGLKGLNTKLVDFSALATGSYRVQVQSSTETITLPVVKGN